MDEKHHKNIKLAHITIFFFLKMNWKNILIPISFYIYLTSLLGITGLKCFIINHVTWIWCGLNRSMTSLHSIIRNYIILLWPTGRTLLKRQERTQGEKQLQLQSLICGIIIIRHTLKHTCPHSCTVRFVKYKMKLYFRVKMSREWLEKAGVCCCSSNEKNM